MCGHWYLKYLPVSLGDALGFPSRNTHEQMISIDTMAIITMPEPIPRTRIKFVCLSFLEEPTDVDVEVEDWCAGALMGDEATIGAVYKR